LLGQRSISLPQDREKSRFSSFRVKKTFFGEQRKVILSVRGAGSRESFSPRALAAETQNITFGSRSRRSILCIGSSSSIASVMDGGGVEGRVARAIKRLPKTLRAGPLSLARSQKLWL